MQPPPMREGRNSTDNLSWISCASWLAIHDSRYLKMITVPSETASSVPMPVTNSGWVEASIVPM